MQLFESRHRAANARLQRRFFLKAVGLGVAAPVAASMAKYAIAMPTRHTRLFIYFIPHGVPGEHYQVFDDMDFSASGVGILSPLEPFKKYVTVPQGLAVYDSGDSHSCIRDILTGSQTGNSIDALIAEQLGVPAHVIGAHCYPSGFAYTNQDSFLAYHNGWVTPTMSPEKTYEELFAGLASGSGGMPDPDAQFRMQTLDFTAGEVEKLQGALSGLTKEQNKLAGYLSSLQARREALVLDPSTLSCEERPSLPSLEEVRGVDPFDLSSFAKILKAQLEISAHALRCGTARIITHQNMYAHAAHTLDFPGGPGLSESYHNVLSHADVGSTDLREKFALAQKWFYQMLADHFLALLDVPDPLNDEGTILDNTTVLTCSEISDGNMHWNFSRHTQTGGNGVVVGSKDYPAHMPWVIIGKGGGYFSGNRIAPWWDLSSPASSTLHPEGLETRALLTAVAETMGASVNFGGKSYEVPAEVKA